MSAWLPGVGYADTVANTGFHPLDGAEWLRQQGAPEGVVALVAFHFAGEAEERGLGVELARFPAPDQDQLDVLTFIDMSTSPTRGAGRRQWATCRDLGTLPRGAPRAPG